MPVYRTSPDVSLDDLIAKCESGGERVIQVLLHKKGQFTVVTQPRLVASVQRERFTTPLGKTETR